MIVWSYKGEGNRCDAFTTLPTAVYIVFLFTMAFVSQIAFLLSEDIATWAYVMPVQVLAMVSVVVLVVLTKNKQLTYSIPWKFWMFHVGCELLSVVIDLTIFLGFILDVFWAQTVFSAYYVEFRTISIGFFVLYRYKLFSVYHKRAAKGIGSDRVDCCCCGHQAVIV